MKAKTVIGTLAAASTLASGVLAEYNLMYVSFACAVLAIALGIHAWFGGTWR